MDMIKTDPAVFAVGREYQIMVGVTCPVLMWVEVGGECYYDDSNGILRSAVTTHRMCVPAAELERAGAYKLCMRKIIERKPYFTETEDEVSLDYEFRPVKGGRTLAYHVADAHNLVDAPIRSAETFRKLYGEIDFLIMNGDVPDHSGRIENFDNIYQIAAGITHGNVPVVFSRGNHDTRGVYAENIAEHTPCENGNSFFSFRLGDIWGVAMDCGEDKGDWHAEYGHTVCCAAFRKRETRWLEGIIENADKEYAADGVKHRVCVVHNPFTWNHPAPFNIEQDTYGYWAKRLKEDVKIELMISGHLHWLGVAHPGDEHDRLGHPCDIAVGSLPNHSGGSDGKGYFAGMGLIFDDDGIEVHFTDSEGKELEGER
ncbi:MAG: hypothetical protein HFE63_10495 [Clostridiales bacterium]|nr:hypothetical protein [Clostridiales bacterium]